MHGALDIKIKYGFFTWRVLTAVQLQKVGFRYSFL